jgi:hypothetical protein
MNATLRRAGSTSAGSGSSAEVDSRGRFLIEGLMAGEYELVVNAFIPSTVVGQQPTRFPSIRQNISVSEAGEASVTLVYDLSKTNEPKP